MDTIYSLALLVSFACGVIALLLSLTLFMKHPQLGPRRLLSFRHGMMVIIAVAVVALLVSLGMHLAFGHRPGSEHALGFAAFLATHPSFLVAFALPLAAGFLAWRYCSQRSKQRQDTSG